MITRVVRDTERAALVATMCMGLWLVMNINEKGEGHKNNLVSAVLLVININERSEVH